MKKILIVDDEPDYLRLLHLRLSGFGYAVVTIDNGNNILVTARNTKPDLIVLDINISEVNGFEVYRLLRRDSGLSHIPVIFSSADASHYGSFQRNEYPNALFLAKPFGNEEILEAIAKLASNPPSRR
jgi:CheY-like chemotaxis protein